MKLVRFGNTPHERPGIIDSNGRARDLSAYIADITPATLRPESLARLSRLNLDSLPIVEENVRIAVPINGVRKYIAVGLNYEDHARESNLPIPQEPIVFTKAISCINGPNDDVMLPQQSKKSDWEVELGIVLGSEARYVPESEALDFIAGYVLLNDLSEREFQLERGLTWDKGKGFDTFGPVGPWLVTKDEILNPNKLDMWLDVNGRRMQTGNTASMIFKIPTLVSYVSRLFTLWPGDIIATGTPPGVGSGKIPPVYLKAGDTMSLGISGLGQQQQTVIPFSLGR